jgi:hypothetical protein
MDLRVIGLWVWTGFIWPRTETVAGSSEHSNEPPCFVKCWEFLRWVSNCSLLKKNLPPWSYLMLKFVTRQDIKEVSLIL